MITKDTVPPRMSWHVMAVIALIAVLVLPMAAQPPGPRDNIVAESGPDPTTETTITPNVPTAVELRSWPIRNEANNHFYKLLPTHDVTWDEAMTLAANHSYKTMPGHLVTITSQQEQEFLVNAFGAYSLQFTWAGGTDAEHEGVWKWACGPEAGQVFYQIGAASEAYHNWDRLGLFMEPNNGNGRQEEDYLAWNSLGTLPDVRGVWNDAGEGRASYIIVEFSSTSSADTVHHDKLPQACDAVCVDWDDAWQVYGYTLGDQKWHVWESPPTAPIGHGVFTYTASKVAVMDGNGIGMNLQRELSGWLLDIASNTWSRIPAIPLDAKPSAGAWLSFVEFVGDKLVAIGSVQGVGFAATFDIPSGKWTRVNTEMLIALKERTIHGVIDSTVAFWGGYPNAEHLGAVYDVAEDRWTKMPPAPLKFGYEMGMAVWNGSLVVCAGKQRDGYQPHGARFDLATNQWSLIATVPSYVGMAAAVTTVGDKMFIFTNHDEDEPGRESSIYSLRTDEWRKVPRSPLIRHDVAYAVGLGRDKVLVFGGWNGQTERFVRDAAIFDLTSNSWTKIDPVPGDVPAALHPGW
jgi:hypothetical protein